MRRLFRSRHSAPPKEPPAASTASIAAASPMVAPPAPPTAPAQGKRLFISYSRRDVAVVEAVARHLTDAGYGVWFDSALEGGQHWWDAILDAIRASDAFVTMLSPDSLSSAPCLLELRYALALGKPTLPVRLSNAVDPNTMLPEALRLIQLVNLTTVVEIPQQGSAGWERLEAAVRGACDAASPDQPTSIPDPPAAPIGSLVILRELVAAPWLSPEMQASVALQLKARLKNEQVANEARLLLQTLARRGDLVAWVEDDIVEALQARPIVDPHFARDASAPVVITAETMERLRELTGARPLGERDSGRPLSRLPNGVYGYTTPWMINTDAAGVVGGTGVERITLEPRSGGTLVMEIHKARSGGVYVVGYTDQQHVAQMATPGEATKIEIELFFAPNEEFDTPLAIPVERIMSSDQRSMGGRYVNDMEIYIARG